MIPNDFSYQQFRLWLLNPNITLANFTNQIKQQLQIIGQNQIELDQIATFIDRNSKNIAIDNLNIPQNTDYNQNDPIIIVEFKHDDNNWYFTSQDEQNHQIKVIEEGEDYGTQDNFLEQDITNHQQIQHGQAAAAAVNSIQSGNPDPSGQLQLNNQLPKNTLDISGICGLGNLGNTCYMNSVLQCINQTQEIQNYIVKDLYQQEINFNNPLGSKGQFITEFAQLIKSMQNSETSYIDPIQFKITLGQVFQIFEGNSQHDAQEFLSFLLDGIHEDINRIQIKPYLPQIENYNLKDDVLSQFVWKQHIQRNQSLIVDILQGIFKSEITCQNCFQKSRKFDPFMSFPLQIPNQNQPKMRIYFSKTNGYQNQFKYNYLLNEKKEDKNNTILNLKNFFEENFEIPAEQQYIALVSYQFISRQLDDDQIVNQNFRDKIASSYDLFCFQISQQELKIPINDRVILNIYQVKLNKEMKKFNFSYVRPMFFTLKSTLKQVHEQIFEFYFCYFGISKENYFNLLVEQQKIPYKILIKSNSQNYFNQQNYEECYFCKKSNCKNCELPYNDNLTLQDLIIQISDNNFELELEIEWEILDSELNLINKYPLRKDQNINQQNKNNQNLEEECKEENIKENNITLKQCFEASKQPEMLTGNEQWYCSNCKCHQDAEKKMQIYRPPKNLILHLKRFKHDMDNNMIMTKIHQKVDFPIKNLDISDFVIENEDPIKYYNNQSFIQKEIVQTQYDLKTDLQYKQQQQQNNQNQQQNSCKYDLYAVVNHYGTMDNGHYTSFCKEFKTNQWFSFDDSGVEPLQQKQIVTDNAYILFYRQQE